MAKRSVLMVLTLTLMVFVAGCAEKETSLPSGPSVGGAFIGGTEGLTMQFMPGAPPEEVYDTNYPFTVDVKVENSGEWDISTDEARFKITGIDPTDFGLVADNLTKSPEENLSGAQKDPQGNVIQGTITDIEYASFQYSEMISGMVQFNIKAEACYEYGTRAQTQLCVKEDLLGKTGEEGVCDANEDKAVDNSGAPIHVTSFTEAVTGSDKLSFVFNIEHVGDGRVYRMDTDCSTELIDKNKVYVALTDPGIGALSCSGLDPGPLAGYATLYNGERSIRCTLSLNPEDKADYEKVLNLQIEYGYKESIDTPLIVKHSG